MTVKTHTPEEVAHLIQKLLRSRFTHGRTVFRLSPNGVSVRQDPFAGGEWYYVELLAEDSEVPMTKYAQMFGEIEQELEDKHGVDALLIPTAII